MHFYAFSTNHQRSAFISIWLTLTTSRIGRGLVEINATNTIFCQVSDARSGPTPVLLPRAGCCKYIIITILNSVSCDEHYCKCFVYNDSGNENDCLERLWKWGGEFLRDFHFCVLYNILIPNVEKATFANFPVCVWPVEGMFNCWALVLTFSTLVVISVCTSRSYTVLWEMTSYKLLKYIVHIRLYISWILWVWFPFDKQCLHVYVNSKINN